VLGGYFIFYDNRQFSSRPSKKKNGSESQSKSVSAVLKGKRRREKEKEKENKTKEGENLRTARSCHFRLPSFGQVF